MWEEEVIGEELQKKKDAICKKDVPYVDCLYSRLSGRSASFS